MVEQKIQKPPFAFPRNSDSSHYAGMTLRDYFAGQALAAMDGESKHRLYENIGEENLDLADEIAVSCYEIADAMLAERERAK